MNIYETRRQALIKGLQAKAVGQAFIFAPANVFYYTGFLSEPHERFMALYVNAKTGDEHLFVPALDFDAAKQAADMAQIHPISDNEVPFEIVKAKLGEMSGTLGIESKVLNYYNYQQFAKTFPKIDFADILDIISAQRMKKTREEIDQIMVPIQLIEKVLAEGIKKVERGMTEIELTAELEFLMRKFGADGPSFSTIVLSGEKAALPHGVPGTKKIVNGELLLIDFGVIKDGYCSDITRTFAVGDVPQHHKDLYNIVLEANNTGIQTAQAGVPLKEIDIKSRAVIEVAGYGKYYNNRVGHGLGIEVHEEPSVHGANEMLTKEGMVFTIEPGIYIPGETGIRIEDNVFINEKGEAEVLTSFPKDLQTL